MAALWNITGLAGAILSALVVWNVFRNGLSRLTVSLVLYCVVVLTSDLPSFVEMIEPDLVFADRRSYVVFYWICESTLQVLTFSLILSLLARVMPDAGYRLLAAIPAAGLVCVLSFWFAFEAGRGISVSAVMTPVIRNLTFFACLLTAALWGAILRRRKLDRGLMLLASGTGLLTAGKAAGHAIRWLAGLDPSIVLAGNVVIVVTGLSSLLVWWFASRQPLPARST
ncbi:MAG: hypothetical protein R2729_08020 [Bryobacteraceae bacterium]